LPHRNQHKPRWHDTSGDFGGFRTIQVLPKDISHREEIACKSGGLVSLRVAQ
jgi:hypothetical protein